MTENSLSKEKKEQVRSLEDLCLIMNNVLRPLEDKDNYKKSLEKFETNIKSSISQIDNRVILKTLNLPEGLTDEQILVHQKDLEDLAEEWSNYIGEKLSNIKEQKTDFKSASMEIDYWRTIVSSLSIINQQLRTEIVVLNKDYIFRLENSSKKTELQTKITNFEKEFEDTSDYLKFLSTLERSIKDLGSDDLSLIEQSIEGIYHNLKIIYLISKHKDSSKFGRLLETIAREIIEKIYSKISMKKLFIYVDKSLNLITQSQAIASKWGQGFREAKTKTKWDFSTTYITNPIDYMSKICTKLSNSVKKVNDFNKFLGPELKRVIGGSSDTIDKQKENVKSACKFLEEYSMNIFSLEYEDQTTQIFKQFDESMINVENGTIKLIDDTFEELRSAESTYDLFQNFENLIKQEKIEESMSTKYENILEQFIKEVKEFETFFHTYKDNPPISKAKPLESGKISWARQIYVKMKRPLYKIFKNKKKNSDKGKILEESFKKIAKELKTYEEQIFDKWKNECEINFMKYLRNNILVKIDADGNPIEQKTSQKSEHRYIDRYTKVEEEKDEFEKHEKPRYKVNFDLKLKLMIRNTKYLDLNGFVIPKNIINIAHQEVVLARYCNSLNLMLMEYDELMDLLNDQHLDLLLGDLKKLKRKIEIGCFSHNWTSLGIDEFIRDCLEKIYKLKDRASSVLKSEEKIRSILKQIGNANLVRDFEPDSSRDLPTFIAFYNDFKKKVLADLVLKYDEISNIICEIEKSSQEEKEVEKREGTSEGNFGQNEKMAKYYRFWEMMIFSALTKTVLKAIITIFQFFSMQRNEIDPLFTIKAKFISNKEIMYNANETDAHHMLNNMMESFRKGGREFIRWMDRTCKHPDYFEFQEELGQVIQEDYSYNAAIRNNPDITTYCNQLLSKFSNINKKLAENKEKYNKELNSDEFGSWNQSALSKMEKEVDKAKKLSVFEKVVNKSFNYLNNVFLKNYTKHKLFEENFIINNEELIEKGTQQVMKTINDTMAIVAKKIEQDEIKKISEKIEVYKSKLTQPTGDTESLRKVLDHIFKIKSKKLSMEVKLHNIYEKLHFLELNSFSSLPELKAKFEELQKEWSNLLVKADKKDNILVHDKQRLAQQTIKNAEALEDEVSAMFGEFEANGPNGPKVSLTEGAAALQKYKGIVEDFVLRKNDIIICKKLFSLEIPDLNKISEMDTIIRDVEPVYQYFKEFTEFNESMSNQLFAKLDINVMEKKKEQFEEKMKSMKKFKKYFAYGKLEKMRIDFNEVMENVLVPLKNPIITQRNVTQLFRDLEIVVESDFSVLTLHTVLEQNLVKHANKIMNLFNDAQMEEGIKTKLVETEKEIDTLDFKMKSYKVGTEDKGYIFEDVTEEMEAMQESISNLQQVANNKHAVAFKSKISELEQEINNIMEVIEIWVEVQKKWMYLESIFISEDIRQKLAEEAKQFDNYDRKFRVLMQNCFKKKSIRFQCKEGNKKSDLKFILKNYEQSEKKLTEHLDSKKNEFSRFYFLTEQDLLQILGASDPLATLNPQLIKLYDNCSKLISKDRRTITSMISQEGEELNFVRAVPIESQQQVGMWMNRVDDHMRETLKWLTKMAIYDFTQQPLETFIKNHVGMVCILAMEAWWTFSLEDVFLRVKKGDKYAMKNELKRQDKDLLQRLVEIVRMPELSKHDRLKTNNMIIRTVHGRDIVDQFVRDSILDAKEFDWEKQLRFYWNKSKDDLDIVQCNGSFYSCYEYQGLNNRLVITALNDRCIMTITTALTYFLGSAPQGPAGTGKTETVKDLGKGMGIRVVVQNCSGALDYVFMGQFFSGLTQTGFWGCFDEFNRINPEVLSVITTQIKFIQTQLAAGKDSWILLNKEVKLLPTVGIFITMNPNYEGRSELPDNLKALFRPVTMAVPGRLLICENLLLSEGFADSRRLAQKIDKLYQLSKEQLSKQHHYDWSLRTIKAVLGSAGKLKRGDLTGPEDILLMKALKDINMPKFLSDDANLFEGLLSDLFSDSEGTYEEDVVIREKVAEIMNELDYQPVPAQIDKALQMYEVMLIRHCTMICGPPMTGKSCIVNTLKRFVEKQEQSHIVRYIINPKAQDVPRLYGKKNEMTGDFEIGILANIFSLANQPIQAGKKELRWVILDGDIDAIWIEDMNSVMDDSKQLTLENKDRILMKDYCKMVLESYNIKHSTAATISRLGMVYIDTTILEPKPAYMRWLKSKKGETWDEAMKESFVVLFERYVEPTIKFVLEGKDANGNEEAPLRTIIWQNGVTMVRQLCALLDSVLVDEETMTSKSQLEPFFEFCLVWSCGACIVDEDKDAFTKFVREINGISVSNQLPPNVFDKYYDSKASKFFEWSHLNIVPEYAFSQKQKFGSILIPTSDVKKYSWLLSKMLEVKKPCLFVGEPGTGKTVTAQNYLKSLTTKMDSKYLILNTNFSSRTSALDFQTTMEESVDNRFIRTVGPPSGKNLVVFIDDLGMPKVDKYETQQPIAFLKMLIEEHAFYTRDNKDLNKLIDTDFVCSTLPPGNGNNQIDLRFVALFSVFNVSVHHSAAQNIFEKISREYLVSRFGPDSDIPEQADKFTEMVVQFYNNVKKSVKLARTPMKFHYVFNMSDVSKVFLGFSQFTKDKFPDKAKIVRLLRNECLRVFSDKLIANEDKDEMLKILDASISANFKEYEETAKLSPSLFGNFLEVRFDTDEDDEDEEKKPKDRFYQDMGTYEEVKSFLDSANQAYKDAGNQGLDLVFYNDAIEHIVRVIRILGLEGGNGLLVGVGGSGKQSLVRMGSFINDYDVFQVQLTSKFEEKHLREQLVELFRRFKTTEVVKPVVFFFTDEMIIDEGFLELVNNMLTIGIVPAIFENSEKAEIIEIFRPELAKMRLPDTKDFAYGLFVEKIKQNMHIMLSMSPSGDSLKNRCRNFPGLISSCVIDWFFEWPSEALLSVSQYLLSNYKEVEEDMKESIANHIVKVHLSVRDYSKKAEIAQKRYIYSTPKNFLDYIKNFKNVFKQKKSDIFEQIDKLAKGIEVIAKTNKNIEKLRTDMTEQEQQVEREVATLNKYKEDLDRQTKISNETKDEATKNEIYLNEQSIELDKDKKNLAIELENITKEGKQIAIICSSIDAKAIETYGQKKKFEGDTGSLLKLVYFMLAEDKSEKNKEKMYKELTDSEVAAFWSKTSAAVNMMVRFTDTVPNVNLERAKFVNKQLESLKMEDKRSMLYKIFQFSEGFSRYKVADDRKNNLEADLEKKTQMMIEAQEGLVKTKQKITELTAELETLNEKTAREDRKISEKRAKLNTLRKLVDTAGMLFSNLSQENDRWIKEKEKLIKKKDLMLGDCMLGASFLSYCGPFSFEFRSQMVYKDWKEDVKQRNIPISEDFSIKQLLATEMEMTTWNIQGLPDDDLSLENGILTVNASRWPICIDPEMQAVRWIKKKEENKLKVVSLSQENYMKFVIGAIKNGTTVLIESIGTEIDPTLNPVLEKNYKIKAGMPKIYLDNQEINVDEDFRLFLTTKLNNPHYTPEVMAKAMIINYAVTMDGLEDQLLNEVIRSKENHLEEARIKVINEMNEGKNELAACEISLLKSLSSADPNQILHNDELIEELNTTKAKAFDVNITLENSMRTKIENDQQRRNYQEVARRGSILYFAMVGLRLISPMYEYSLNSFMRVHKMALDEAQDNAILSNKLENMKRKLTQLVYEYVCMSVFEKHKLLFSFHMTSMIMKYEKPKREEDEHLMEGDFDSEMSFFLKGNTEIGDPKMRPVSWLSDTGLKDLEKLITFPPFKNLVRDLTADESEWRTWFDSEKPEDEEFPSGYSANLTPYQKLMLMRVFRKDRIYNSIINFIKETMGDFYVDPPSIQMEKIFSQSSESIPILFILSPGSDPLSYVSSLAQKRGFFEKKFRYMSLGQKQEKEATDMIQDGVKRGLWIMLQNCDLLEKWLPDLENIIDSIEKPKPEFRLWLTTSPIPSFPIGILQKSFKVVTEPPEGLSLNMMRVYNNISEEGLETDSKHYGYKSLIYALSFFHSVLQDRKKFGKIGWNLVYDFNESDFQISKQLLSNYLNKISDDDPIPWASLKYLIGEAMYGGRVTDEYDRRVMMTYLDEYFGEFLFDQNQKFFFSKVEFEYVVPEAAGYDYYMKCIKEYPGVYSPEVIGLHSNAEINYFTQASISIWTNMIVLQDSVATVSLENLETGAVSVDSDASGLANKILEKVYDEFDMKEFNKKYPKKTPIDSVLGQELERFNQLVSKMRESLITLKEALSGAIAMNSEMDELMASLMNSFIPANWKALAPETQKPLASWLEHLSKRYAQYKDWFENGEPKVMWLPGMHVPSSYLKAIIQITTRKKGWPLDKTDIYTVVTTVTDPAEIKEKLEFGCYLSGMYLEGASWDMKENCLVKQKPKELISEMPLIQVIPEEANKIKLRNNLKTPVYMTQNRVNIKGDGLVFEADLRTVIHPNLWILQGVALVLNTYI